MPVPNPVKGHVGTPLEYCAYVALGILLKPQVSNHDLCGVSSLAYQELHLLGTEPVGRMGDYGRTSDPMCRGRRSKYVRFPLRHVSLAGRNLDRSCAVPGAPHALCTLAHEPVRQCLRVQRTNCRVEGSPLFRKPAGTGDDVY